MLGPIPTSHRHRQANDFPPAFQPGANHRSRHDIGKQWIGGNQYLGAWDEHTEDSPRPTVEEKLQRGQIAWPQNCKAGKRRALMTVVTRRNPPHAPLAGAKLRLLVSAIFHEPIRRIRHDCVNAFRLTGLQPGKTVRFHKSRAAASDRLELLRALGPVRPVNQIQRLLILLLEMIGLRERVASPIRPTEDIWRI